MLTLRSRDRRCPRCGTRVALQAKSCLLCGYRLDKGGYLGAGAALVVVAIVSGIAIGALRDRSGAEPVSTRPLSTPPTGIALAATSAPLGSATATPQPSPTAAPTFTPEPSPTPTETPVPEPTATETPEPTATPEASPTPLPGPLTHTVARGDSLLAIAQRYGTTVSALTAANGITERTILRVGQELIVPTPTPAPQPEATEPPAETATPVPADTPAPTVEPQIVVHIVESGDSLIYIADKYDTTVAAILAANPGLTERSLLRLGQEIKVPTTNPGATSQSTGEGATVMLASSDVAVTPQAGAPAPTAVPTNSLLSMGGPAQPRALELLSPIAGAKVLSRGLLFNWTGVGNLGSELWYVVHVWPFGEYDNKTVGWTRANSWRPEKAQVELWGDNAHLMWSVGIERELATAQEGAPRFEPAGPRTEPQDFYVVSGE